MLIGIVCTNHGIPLDVFVVDTHNAIDQRTKIVLDHFPNCRCLSTSFDKNNFCRKWRIQTLDNRLCGYLIYQKFKP